MKTSTATYSATTKTRIGTVIQPAISQLDKTQPRRGTIGYAIAKLAREFGDGTKGIYIIEQALLRVTGAKSVTYQDENYNDMLMSETPYYKFHSMEEQLIIQRVGKIPAAACPLCGGWTAMGGMSQHSKSETPVMGRTGCEVAHNHKFSEVAKENVFNPENIEAGDTVRLQDDDKMINHTVQTVSGKNNNKVFCKRIGRELYASCFILVRKA